MLNKLWDYLYENGHVCDTCNQLNCYRNSALGKAVIVTARIIRKGK